jgi:anion-transporting  ArsA/GET3 family ATPase
VFSVLTRLTGVDLLSDLSVFFRALGGLIDGFRERARGVGELLGDPATTFLIVTSPEREPAEEAVFFHSKLAEAKMPFGGLIVNRVHRDGLDGHSAAEVTELLQEPLGERLAQRVANNLADFDVLVRRDRDSIARLSGQLDDPHPIVIPHLDVDVHDIAGLAAIERHLFA